MSKYHLSQLEFYYLDFKKGKFNNQAAQIYKNVKYAVETNNKALFRKYFLSNVLDHEESGKLNIKEIFQYETFDWKIMNCTNLYAGNILNPLHHNFSQITMEYKIKINKDHIVTKYMVFQRPFSENVSYHSWKIFIPDYTEI